MRQVPLLPFSAFFPLFLAQAIAPGVGGVCHGAQPPSPSIPDSCVHALEQGQGTGHSFESLFPATPTLADLERSLNAFFRQNGAAAFKMKVATSPVSEAEGMAGFDVALRNYTELKAASEEGHAYVLALFELARTASKRFAALGIEHEVALVQPKNPKFGMPIPEILLSAERGSQELNELARQRWANQKVAMRYSPFALELKDTASSFSSNFHPTPEEVGHLYLGSAVVSSASANEKDLLHELRHADTFDLMKRGQESVLHGGATTDMPWLKGRLPMGPLVFPLERNKHHYSKYISFDELAAWAISIRERVREVRTLLDSGQDGSEAIADLPVQIKIARVVSSQIVGICDCLAAIIESGNLVSYYTLISPSLSGSTRIFVPDPGRSGRFRAWRGFHRFVEDGKVYGILKAISDPYMHDGEDEVFQVEIPLLTSTGETDPGNAKALDLRIGQISSLAYDSMTRFRRMELLAQAMKVSANKDYLDSALRVLEEEVKSIGDL